MAFDMSVSHIAIGWKGWFYFSGMVHLIFHRILLIFCSFRIWWIMAIVLSIYLCSTTIYGLKRKWNESPVIISYDAKLLPISTIPFPAMTICPVTRISAKKFNFTKTYRTLFKLDNHDTPNVTNEE